MRLSVAGYEPERFGPPPTDFEAYLAALARLKLFMNRGGESFALLKPPRTLDAVDDPDLDWFVTFVWWWTRLRVRSGRLVLEVRPVPRSTDADLAAVFAELRAAAGF